MAVDPLQDAGGRLALEAAAAYVGELFEQHGRMVYGVCRLLLRDREEAEDAAQQTFLSAHRSILGGTEPREPAAWLGAIARNECHARNRARMAMPLALVRDEDAPAPGVEEVAAKREEIAALAKALGELPRSQRDAVVLREFYGLSYDEVGAALGVSQSAVDSLLVRARRRLQDALRPARVASGVLVVPAALRDSLAEALPGFASSGPGMLARVAALPIAAKLAGAAATVAVVGSVGAVGYRSTDLPPVAKAPAAARAADPDSAPTPRRELPVLQESPAAEDENGWEDGGNRGPGGGQKDDESEDRSGPSERSGPDSETEDEESDNSGPGDGSGESEESEESEDSGGPDEPEDDE